MSSPECHLWRWLCVSSSEIFRLLLHADTICLYSYILCFICIVYECTYAYFMHMHKHAIECVYYVCSLYIKLSKATCAYYYICMLMCVGYCVCIHVYWLCILVYIVCSPVSPTDDKIIRHKVKTVPSFQKVNGFQSVCMCCYFGRWYMHCLVLLGYCLTWLLSYILSDEYMCYTSMSGLL